jgi:Ca2+:H+ antiporter
MASPSHLNNPAWTYLAPLCAALLLGLKLTGVISAEARPVLVLATLALGATVFAAVHHAEILAVKLGEPFGSILLAVAVTVIEVALIVSIMITGEPGSGAVARDTVFSAVMIVLNGVIGLCLVLGAQRHHEQSFQVQGASAALAVLGTLAVLTLVLPNYTVSVLGPHYSPLQLGFVGLVSFILYAVFVFVQTIRHRDYFLQADEVSDGEPDRPASAVALASVGLLLISLIAVVLLAKILSQPLDRAIEAAGLPQTFVGVVIAAVVLLPEGLAATKAALRNRLQTSINLALGSAIASIGLTIPAVSVVSLVLGQTLALGLTSETMVLLTLTLFSSTLTLGTGRTTVLQGAVHLVIFATFILLAAAP